MKNINPEEFSRNRCSLQLNVKCNDLKVYNNNNNSTDDF